MSQSRQFYSELEKSLLVELAGKHKDVLESKKNDYKSIRQKNIAWEALSHEFNSQSGVTKRDSKQLKKCLENVKARAKKQIAEERCKINWRRSFLCPTRGRSCGRSLHYP